MGGSEMGDLENADDTFRSKGGQRISARERRPVNYNNIV